MNNAQAQAKRKLNANDAYFPLPGCTDALPNPMGFLFYFPLALTFSQLVLLLFDVICERAQRQKAAFTGAS